MKNSEELFTKENQDYMRDLFGRMEKPLLLKLKLDERELSQELEAYIGAIAELTDKIKLQVTERNASSDTAPCVEVCLADGTATGLAFHGVPAGHELSSFVTGLYNAAGPGEALEEGIRQRIASLKTPLELKVLVTLSCPMCPELVKAAQHIAAENSGVTAHIYDVRNFEKISNRYNVMSVPCLVVNDRHLSVGRKSMRELLDYLEGLK